MKSYECILSFFPFHNRKVCAKLKNGLVLNGVFLDYRDSNSKRKSTEYLFIDELNLDKWLKAKFSNDVNNRFALEKVINIQDILAIGIK